MFPGLGNTKIYLCREPVDMRKSYDSLAALVSSELGEDPLSGSLFVFLNRQRNRVKIIYYESGGFCIWMKRLEIGSFSLPLGEGTKQKIDPGALSMLLEGLKVVKMKRFCA
jgi:transposase